MTSKQVYGHEAKKEVLAGANILCRAVQTTYGPTGRNMGCWNGQTIDPEFSKDGATVAGYIDDDNPLHKIGMELVRSVVDRVDAIAGDGSTTATIYTTNLMNKGEALVNLGLDANEIRRGVQKASDIAENYLKEKAEKSEDIRSLAMIATNGHEELSGLFEKAFKSIGEGGVVQLFDSNRRSGESYVEIAAGFSWSSGIVSTLFTNDTAQTTATIRNPKVLVIDKHVDEFRPIQGIIDACKNENLPVVIIAPSFEEILYDKASEKGVTLIYSPAMSMNRDRNYDELTDIATLLGTKVVPGIGNTLEYIKGLGDMGSCASITATLNKTTIEEEAELTPEKAKAIEDYVKRLRARLDDNDELSINQNELLKARLAQLTGGIANIYIGALTKVEKDEKAAAALDALNTIKNARKYGILPGGGTAMLKASNYLEENMPKDLTPTEVRGYNAVVETLRIPAQILIKSIKPNDYQYLVQQVAHTENFWEGYSLKAEKIEDLKKVNIIDSAAIEFTVVKYAASTVGTFIMTEGFIIPERANMLYHQNDPAALEARRG